MPGAPNLLVEARAALLDALDALAEQDDSLILVGAQAIYLRTGEAEVAIAAATKDSDFAVDPALLQDDPQIQNALEAAGFTRNPNGNPGAWLSTKGIEVDLMVPQELAPAGSGSRSVAIDPHDRHATRKTAGLEAAVVDWTRMQIEALGEGDDRVREAKVAGPSALLVAKLYKVGERIEIGRPIENKDAHDIFRLLLSVETDEFKRGFTLLANNPISIDVAERAVSYLDQLFAGGPDAVGSRMAGQAVVGLGDVDVTATQCAFLAQDLIEAIR